MWPLPPLHIRKFFNSLPPRPGREQFWALSQSGMMEEKWGPRPKFPDKTLWGEARRPVTATLVGPGGVPTKRGVLRMMILLFLLLLPSVVLAHGVEGEVEYHEGCVIVTATYDTGEPMSYAKVEIHAPDSKVKFQSGRTDRNGCFAFVPDVPGKWRVVVSDGLGHRLELSVEVTDLSSKIPA